MCSDGKHEENRRLKQVLDQLHLGATTAFRKVKLNLDLVQFKFKCRMSFHVCLLTLITQCYSRH